MAFNDVIVKQVRYECIYLFFFGRVAKGITRMLTGLKGMSGDDFVMENFSRAAPTKKGKTLKKKKFRPFLITGWKTSLLLPSREETSGKKGTGNPLALITREPRERKRLKDGENVK